MEGVLCFKRNKKTSHIYRKSFGGPGRLEYLGGVFGSSQVVGTLFVTGNIIAQQFVKPRGLKSHNFYRILRLGGFGLCIGSIAGPSTAIWSLFRP
ncbi:13191_t:CDS:2, partial [Rhizophagus irregularis]